MNSNGSWPPRTGGKLTRQLLTYSRKIKSEKRSINLNDQINQVHLLLQRTIPKMIQIELRLEADLKRVDCGFGSNGAGVDEPGDQCQRRHAGWRPAGHRDVNRQDTRKTR